MVTCQLWFTKSTPADSHSGNVFHAHILNLICPLLHKTLCSCAGEKMLILSFQLNSLLSKADG